MPYPVYPMPYGYDQMNPYYGSPMYYDPNLFFGQYVGMMPPTNGDGEFPQNFPNQSPQDNLEDLENEINIDNGQIQNIEQDDLAVSCKKKKKKYQNTEINIFIFRKLQINLLK